MSRLTEKNKFDTHYEISISKNLLQAAYDKLGQLEDLEEQLGCPLEVRERAFDNGFYDENGNHYICEHYVPYLKAMHTRGIMNGTSKSFKLKDYKKTWWLREDKSE